MTLNTNNNQVIYTFAQGAAEGSAGMRDLLGGKGANLAEMCNLNLPVPAGVTITTEACKEYRSLTGDAKRAYLHELASATVAKLDTLNDKPYQPIVSVRSGARVSMAGMMDTVLNVGVNPSRFSELFQHLGAKTTLDSYRRLQQMYGTVVLGMDPSGFDKALNAVKAASKVSLDSELNENDLMTLINTNRDFYKACGLSILDLSFEDQLAGAIGAVFDSWDTDRAKVYRKHHNIPEDWGTAVNIQLMVFGNAAGVSGSGVLFSRDTNTGANKLKGEYLLNAQGEDVVAGVRTPNQIVSLAKVDKKLYQQLKATAKKLEQHYNDVQDIEFTIENGKLYILQTRAAKRTAEADLKFASDFINAGCWDYSDLKEKVNPDSFNFGNKKVLDLSGKPQKLAKGLGTGGVGAGVVAHSKEEGLAYHEKGVDFILWAKETTPNDLAAMLVAKGIVTAVGGQTCHAAVVARSLNLPCVVGTGVESPDGTLVTLDADAGIVYSGLVPWAEETTPEHVTELLRYIAECEGVAAHNTELEGVLYLDATVGTDEPLEGTVVLDVSGFEQKLNRNDRALLDLIGVGAGAYADDHYKDLVEKGISLIWLNDLIKANKVQGKLVSVSGNRANLGNLVELSLSALGVTPAQEINTSDLLITCEFGEVDEDKIREQVGLGTFEYLKKTLQASGLYPREAKPIATKQTLLKLLRD